VTAPACVIAHREDIARRTAVPTAVPGPRAGINGDVRRPAYREPGGS
jgi:hypothetical protein